jgi:glycerophosphoryl diester phosphodiesterase
MGVRQPAISAHRGGSEKAPADTVEAYQRAVKMGAEYVEFDVRQTCDETLVACHASRTAAGRAIASLTYPRLCALAGQEIPQVADVLRLLAGRALAHLDLKDAKCAPALVAQALGISGPEGFLVTTRNAALVADLKRRCPAVTAGLTIGGDSAETARFTASRITAPRRSRLARAVACHADVAVVHHRLARHGILRQCRALGFKTMVWTVNTDLGLAQWVASPDVDVLVTDRPGRALELRDCTGNRYVDKP